MSHKKINSKKCPLLNKQQEYKTDFTVSPIKNNKTNTSQNRPCVSTTQSWFSFAKNVSVPNSKSNISIHISLSASVRKRSILRKCTSLTSKEDCIGSLFNSALLQNNVISINIAPEYYNSERRRYVFDDSSDEEHFNYISS